MNFIAQSLKQDKNCRLAEFIHEWTCFKDSADRRLQLILFINFYNTVKPHKSLNNATPYEILAAYFN